MSAFLLLALCPLLGMLCARQRWMPDNAPETINAWLLRIALPAVILEQIPKLHFDPRLLFPAVVPWLLMLSTMALMSLLGRRLNWSRSRIGAMTLCWGLGNTSFVGFPLLLALIGPAALGAAVIADQSTFFVVNLIGLPVAAWYAGQESHPLELIRRVFRFAPFLALFPAMAVGALGGWPPIVDTVLHRLGDTLTPLALFSVGLQFHPGAAWKYRGLIAIGATWKLLTVPLVLWGSARMLDLHGMPISVGILQMAMAPMITSGIIAREYRLEPEAANAMISVGIAISFISVPLWNQLIGLP